MNQCIDIEYAVRLFQNSSLSEISVALLLFSQPKVHIDTGPNLCALDQTEKTFTAFFLFSQPKNTCSNPFLSSHK